MSGKVSSSVFKSPVQINAELHSALPVITLTNPSVGWSILYFLPS